MYIHQHPNRLLEHTTGLLLFDLLEQASYICNDATMEALLPPPKGLYLKGSVKPLLSNTKSYYAISDPTTPIDLDNVLLLREDIIDHTGDVVLSGRNLTYRPHVFTTTPTLPITAIQICHNILVDYLFRYCKHARGIRSFHIRDYIHESMHVAFDDVYFEEFLTEALDELHDFIRHQDECIYMTRLKGSTLIIERYIDWRIFEYTEMMYNKQQEEASDFY